MDSIFTKDQLLQMRNAGANFYATADDGQKFGVYNGKAISLSKERDQYRQLQPYEEFERAISLPSFCIVLTENSMLVVIDKDTANPVKISKPLLCTYRKKYDYESMHCILIAKSLEDVKKFAAADGKLEGLEVFTFHRNNVLCMQGDFRWDNNNPDPKQRSTWWLYGGDLEKLKQIPEVHYESIAALYPEWGQDKKTGLGDFNMVDINIAPPPHKAHDSFNKIAIKCMGFLGYDEQQTLQHLQKLNAQREYPHTGKLEEYVKSAKKYVDENKQEVDEGSFYKSLNSDEKPLFRSMVRDGAHIGLDEETVKHNLETENSRLDTSLSDGSIDKLMARLDVERQNHALYTIQKLNEGATKYDKAIFESIEQKGIIEWPIENTGNYEEDKEREYTAIQLVKANQHRILATYIMRFFSFKTNNKTDEMYVNLDGRYVQGGDVTFKTALTQTVPALTAREINEAMRYCQRLTYVDIKEFDKYSYLLNFLNGFLDIRTGIFYDAKVREKLKHQLLFMKMYNVNYIPNSKCPKIEKFLEEIIPDEQMRTEVLERLALSLIPHYTHGKYVVFLGISHNGKTQLMDILIHGIHGLDSVASLSLQELIDGTHALEQLIGKTVNISGDLPKKGVEDMGRVKNILEGSPVSVNPKGKKMYDKIFNMMFYALSNHAIDFDDTPSGWKRLEVFHFTTEIDTQSEVKNLGKKLAAGEAEGFLILLLQHAQNIVQNGLTNVQNWSDARDKWRVIPDRLKQAVKQGIKKGEEGEECSITASQIYGIYVNFMTVTNANNTKNGMALEKLLDSGRSFIRRLHIANPELNEVKKHTKINNIHEWVYHGFKIKEEYKDKLFTV